MHAVLRGRANDVVRTGRLDLDKVLAGLGRSPIDLPLHEQRLRVEVAIEGIGGVSVPRWPAPRSAQAVIPGGVPLDRDGIAEQELAAFERLIDPGLGG